MIGGKDLQYLKNKGIHLQIVDEKMKEAEMIPFARDALKLI